MRKLLKQIFNFGIVGFLSFLIDYGLLYLLTEYIHIYYLLASGISFSISLIFNYICNMQFVFVGKKEQKKRTQFFIFVILSVIGLCINQLVMFLTVDLYALNYLYSKVIATCFVMVWNFITRKFFLEDKNIKG